MIRLRVKQKLMQSHPRTSLAFSPFLLFHASVQITPTIKLMFYTHYSSVLIQTRCLCCVTCLQSPADYREVVSHTPNLILRCKVTCLWADKAAMGLQAATGASAWAGQPCNSTQWRKALSQCSQFEVCVCFKLTKSNSLWQPWIFLSTQLPTGQMNDRDCYLTQSWRHFIIQ